MIITIGRQHGSSGREIARLLAKELGIKCYDKEIVDEAAKHSDFSRELINAYDEKRMSAFLLHAGGYGLNENFRLNMEVVSAQFDAIRPCFCRIFHHFGISSYKNRSADTCTVELIEDFSQKFQISFRVPTGVRSDL